ncbi:MULTISPECIES: PIG-L deacetylase family protein [unclassified Shewanella]|uniref:PIG-L deacetylase family protein n=1 Tax=unclassified Shewanella TaxID=196818 RepID=UPI0039B3EAE8
MKIEFKNVLVLAPHTDDGELGAGGIISKLVAEGSSVYYVAFSACEESVPVGFQKDVLRTEVFEATAQLGLIKENVRVLNFRVRHFPEKRQEILESLISIRKECDFDLVLLPSTQDIHQDHKTISEEGIRAFKSTNIWGYELNWNQLQTSNTGFIVLDESHVASKVNAIKMYKSQYGRGYCKDDYIISLAKIRGAQIGHGYAESFEVIRTVIR